jgi:tripartite ATP-independent transporter DctM subunit
VDPIFVGIGCLCLFFVLVFIGMPVGYTFASVGFLGFIAIRNFDQALKLLGYIPYSWASGYMLVVIPLFILMGQFAFYSGISAELYRAAYAWLGRKPGGIALATQLACTGFAACTGSSLASAATMGVVAIPEMKRYHYDSKLSTATVVAGGTLGILIPPSIIFIIYGLITETSIGKLFVAGIIPGFLLSLSFMLLIYFMCLRNPKLGPRGEAFTWKEKFKSIWGVWGMLVLFFLTIGGIYLGIFTPTEAGAIGAFGAFLIILIRGQLTLKTLTLTLKSTVQTTAMIFMIVIGAQIFNTFLTLTGTPTMIADWIAGLPFSPYAILTIILLLYIPLGMVMDSLPMILLTLPTLFPVVVNLGFDPILFGVLVVLMSGLANMSPPMGMNLYIVKGVAPEVPIGKIIMGVIPFAVVMMLVVVLLIVFPQISLFLPSLMK